MTFSVRNIFRSALHLFRQADALGTRPEFTVLGQGSYQTYLGALLTLCSLVVVGFSIYSNAYKVFDRSSPSVFCNREFDMDGYEFDIFGENTLPLIAAFDTMSFKTLIPPEVNTFVTLKADFTFISFDFEKHVPIYITIDIPIKPCTEIQNKKPYEWTINYYGFDEQRPRFWCVGIPANFSSLTIQGSRFTAKMSTFRIHMYPCSLANTADCRSSADFDWLTLAMFSQQKFIKYSNFSSPIKGLTKMREEINVSPMFRKVIFNYMKQIRIEDNTNWFMPKHTEPFKYVDIEKEEINMAQRQPVATCTPQQIAQFQCQSYLTMEYRSSGIQETCTRTYVDVLSAISDVGGIQQLLFLYVGLVYMGYNLYFYHRHLRNVLYPESQLQGFAFAQEVKSNETGPTLTHKPQLKVEGREEAKPNVHTQAEISRSFAKFRNSQTRFSQVKPERPPTNANTSEPPPAKPAEEPPKLPVQTPSPERLLTMENLLQLLAEWAILREIICTDYQLQLLPIVGLQRERVLAQQKRTAKLSKEIDRHSSKDIASITGEMVRAGLKWREAIDRVGEGGGGVMQAEIDRYIMQWIGKEKNREKSSEGVVEAEKEGPLKDDWEVGDDSPTKTLKVVRLDMGDPLHNIQNKL